ncbi:Permease of the drug/metabolite transporter (DMT) superfamily [Mameliella alba]|uniref:DMT family transporter n=1 Tax=Mameliella alba TaxID=561184 RepID=UPI00088D30DB|nr:DMT family transporter [Mameliella alba]OWV42465.1 EamA/RhaT family transporter [Mameliella alba]PTR35727.1 drug/metabolite transporter (DMT)-like permease [Mameliella alba]GGF66435.1 membrane protein [Mameliella alba]SDE13749.1 Permease of the drug/metabolite transporter (DMT) superfamily [Mameliella alba]
MSHNAKGALLALLAFGVFSLHDVIVKWLGASYSPVQIVFFSGLFSFPLLTLILIRESQPGTLRPVHPWWLMVRTLSAVITGLSAFYAFSVLPLAQVYAILFAAPLLITLLAIPILGEQVGLRRGIAVVVGLCGVLVVLRPGGTELSLGHLAALVAAFASSLASIIVRKIGQDERSVVMLLYPILTNFIVMGAALPFVYKPMPALELGGLALMSVMAFAASALVIMAYKTGEAVVVAPMQYSQILWAVFTGAVFFNEYPDTWTAAGAGIIIASGTYIVLREGGKSSTNRPVLRSRTRFETGIVPRVRFFRKDRTPRAKDPRQAHD